MRAREGEQDGDVFAGQVEDDSWSLAAELALGHPLDLLDLEARTTCPAEVDQLRRSAGGRCRSGRRRSGSFLSIEAADHVEVDQQGPSRGDSGIERIARRSRLRSQQPALLAEQGHEDDSPGQGVLELRASRRAISSTIAGPRGIVVGPVVNVARAHGRRRASPTAGRHGRGGRSGAADHDRLVGQRARTLRGRRSRSWRSIAWSRSIVVTSR